jgi:hypothetical protein
VREESPGVTTGTTRGSGPRGGMVGVPGSSHNVGKGGGGGASIGVADRGAAVGGGCSSTM